MASGKWTYVDTPEMGNENTIITRNVDRCPSLVYNTHTDTHTLTYTLGGTKNGKLLQCAKANFHSLPPRAHPATLYPIQLISNSPSGILTTSLAPACLLPRTFTSQRSSLGSLSVSHSHTSLPSRSSIAATAASRQQQQQEQQRCQQSQQPSRSRQRNSNSKNAPH